MSRPLTDPEKLRRLPWETARITLTRVYNALLLGSPFPLFLAALGLAKARIGVLSALIYLVAPLSVIVAPAVARFGFKRTFLVFYGTRKIFAALLLLTPWVKGEYGLDAAYWFVAANVLAYAICRAIAETGVGPWYQELVPNSVRGKFEAITNMVSMVCLLAATTWAGHMLGGDAGLDEYLVVMGVGLVFAIPSVLCALPLPGGAPVAQTPVGRLHFQHLGEALRDGNFRRYLAGTGLAALATTAWGTFVPLYLKEEGGIDTGTVVLLGNATLVGTLVSNYLWGWAADRYGSKPVLLLGLAGTALLPVGWMLMPRGSEAWALGLAGYAGVSAGWALGANRILFAGVMPPEKRVDYWAVFYAWTGITSGASPLVAGWGMDLLQGWHLPTYPCFFGASLVLVGLSLASFAGVRDPGARSLWAWLGERLRRKPE